MLPCSSMSTLLSLNSVLPTFFLALLPARGSGAYTITFRKPYTFPMKLHRCAPDPPPALESEFFFFGR